MTKPTRDDLWVFVKGDNEYVERHPTDAELADMGLVPKSELDEMTMARDELAEMAAEAAEMVPWEDLQPADSYRNLWEAAEAKLAEWERHGRKVTVDCPRCGGHGYADIYEPVTVDVPERVTCHNCNGTGSVPAEGVERLEWCQTHQAPTVPDDNAGKCIDPHTPGSCQSRWVVVLPDPTHNP